MSLILRALNNLGKITLSLYISPIIVGPKFTIFGFFISILYYIKFKEKNYKMYDEEGNLIPSVFAKLSSKILIINIKYLVELYLLPFVKVQKVNNNMCTYYYII